MPVPVNSGEEARRIATQRAARRRKKPKPPVSVRPQTKTPVASPPSRKPRPVVLQTDASAPGGAAGYRTTRPERKVRRREIRRARARVERRRALAQERAYRSQGEAVTSQAQRLGAQTHEARVRAALGPPVDVAKVVSDLVAAAGRVHIPSTGGGPSGVRVATGGGGRTAAVLAPRVRYNQSETARNIGRDVVTLGTAPFVAGFELGAGAFEAAKSGGGDTSRLERLGAGLWEGVKESAPGQLAQGDLKGAGKAFGEHPLISLLDVGAATSIAGRFGGAVARGVGKKGPGVRGALNRAGSTVRPPLALTDDPAAKNLVERSYSKDSTRKVVQVAVDRALQPLRREDGSVVTVSQRGRDVPVLKAPAAFREQMQKRDADFAASRANMVERTVREQARREMKVRGIRGAAARDLVSMVVEGTVRSAKTFDKDLRSHRGRLRTAIKRHEAGESVYRHADELKAAKVRLALVEKVLGSPRAMRQRAKIVAAGEAVGRKLNEREREAIELGLLHPGRARRSKLVPAAVEHLDGRHFTPRELEGLDDVTAEAARHGAIRRADGRFLSNDEIENFLRDSGRDPDTVAYLPHRLDVRGGRAFHTQFRPGTRPTLDKPEARTGAAYAKGATEASTTLIRDQGVRQATQISKARALDKLVGEQGRRLPDGRYFTAKQALEAAERLEADTGQRWVPVRALAARLSPETQRMIREELQGPAGMDSLGLRLLNDRIVHDADEPGKARARNVVLVPAATVEQLQRHLRPAGSLQKFLQVINRPFRFAVLAQPRWLTGNFVEPYVVRLTTVGSGVNVLGLGVDVVAATRTLRRMDRSGDPKMRAAAAELRAQQLGGLFIGGRGASVRRGLEDFPGLDRAYGQLVSKLPVVAQGIDLVRLAGHALMAPGGAYFRINRGIENVAQRASLGRDVRRDLQEFTGSWKATLRLQSKALDEVAEGLVNTPTQRRFMRSQHELLGKYEGFPPWLRELVQGPMPFVPWMLNAARFVYWTMPAHRTAQTALLVKVNDVVAADWEQIHKGVPPGSLKLAIPTKAGGWIDLARYTPYGLPAQGDLLGSAVGQFAPAFSGALEAVRGRDPFGRPLALDPAENEGATEPTGLQRAGIAGLGLAEALIPYASQARRLREGGGTAFAGSTIVDPDVKPGTQRMSAARRTFDPFRPTYLGGAAGAPSRPSRPRRRAPADDDLDAAIDAALSDLGAEAEGQDAAISEALDQVAADAEFAAAEDAAIDEALRELVP